MRRGKREAREVRKKKESKTWARPEMKIPYSVWPWRLLKRGGLPWWAKGCPLTSAPRYTPSGQTTLFTHALWCQALGNCRSHYVTEVPEFVKLRGINKLTGKRGHSPRGILPWRLLPIGASWASAMLQLCYRRPCQFPQCWSHGLWNRDMCIALILQRRKVKQRQV